MKIIRKHIDPKMEKAILHFQAGFIKQYVSDFEFYCYFLSHVTFQEAELGTMAAGVHNNRLTIFWDQKFVDGLTLNECQAVLVHELMHLISRHCDRGKLHDRQIANIAMDMIINHLIEKYHGEYIKLPVLTQEFINTIPEDQRGSAKAGDSMGVNLDPNYKGDLVFEPLYDWLIEENEKEKKGQANGLSQPTKDLMKRCADGCSMDVHLDTNELQEEVRKSLAAHATEKAKLDTKRSRGSMAGGMEELLEHLLKTPKKNNLKLLKQMISGMKGTIKMPTFTRLNKRVMGIKGKKKHALEINAILDTSGSMSGEFDLVLTQLFVGGYTVNMIEVDTQIQKVMKITSKAQLKKTPIKGLGGTHLQPAIEYIKDPKNKLARFPTVMLTDGETGQLDFGEGHHQWLVLTTGTIPPITGRAKVLKIER